MEIPSLYFDYAASTPVAPEVFSAMQPYFSDVYANPNSVHTQGQRAQAALDRARKTVADICSVDFRDVIFTASATEANNLALRGVVKKWNQEHANVVPHIITTTIEHASVLDTCKDMEQNKEVQVTYVDPQKNGVVGVKEIMDCIQQNTICISLMTVNNVTGAIQPVQELFRAVQEYKQKRLREGTVALREAGYPAVHTDAAQAVYGAPDELVLGNLRADFITLCAHKIYGPKGAAALIMANGISQNAGRGKTIYDLRFTPSPLITGGDQEFGLHSGTQNVPSIVGFAQALTMAYGSQKTEHARLSQLKDFFVQNVFSLYPKAVVNSPDASVPGIVNISFPGFDLDELVYRFDKAKIAISIGSACHARMIEPSHVLAAMGVSSEILHSAIRFSFGKYTTQEEALEALARMRAPLAGS